MVKKMIYKWDSLSNGIKSSIAFAISSFFIKGISFLTTPIFTRIMSTNDYGIITSYNSWVTIIEIFALLGLTSAGVFNVGLNDKKNSRNEFISSCIGVCNICTLITFFVIFILKLFGIEILDVKLLIIMFIHFLFNPALVFWITRNKYEYKYKFATIISIASSLLSQIVSIVAVVIIDNNAYFNKIVGAEIGSLLFAIPIYIQLIIKGKKVFDKKTIKYVLLLSLPLLPHYLSQHIMASSDKIMISNLVSNTDAAIYGVVANIGLIGTVLWNAINGSIVPYTYEKINNKQEKKVGFICNKLMIVYFIICIILMLIGPEIMKILAPTEYYGGIYIIPPLIIVIFLQALYNLYANIEFYYKRMKNIAISTVIASIINIVLNFIFIPKFSYVAAAYTTLTSYIVLIFLHYINYKKCTKENIYNNKLFLLLVVTLVFVCLLSNLLYSFNYIIRYSLLVIIFVIALYKREEILKLFKEIK